MCIDMGMTFSVNFGHENFLPWDLLEFIGNGIGMSV